MSPQNKSIQITPNYSNAFLNKIEDAIECTLLTQHVWDTDNHVFSTLPRQFLIGQFLIVHIF